MVSAQGAVAQVRDRLPGGYPVLETKLQPPSWRRGLIRRPRLIKQLNESAGVPLVALVAPPGCGKSTLLAEWTTTARRLAAWIHVDERDNDPAVLLGYIAVALDRAVGLAPGVFPALASGGSSIWATAMPSLGSAVAHAADDFVLIFDELENLTNPDGRDALMGLAQHLRPGSQIALATRSAAGLPIPRLVAGGQAVVIEREALALDDQEAGDLLSSAGRGRDASEVHTLNVAAEGWAAGLYLSALTLRPGKAASGSTHPPAIGRQLVEDYLRSELLEQLSDEDARFLIRTAPLDRLNASLCDRVLGDAGSAATLERIERSTMFLTPLGMDRRWFRLHSLLREFLLGEVRRQEPDQMVERERRAAAWFEAAGDEEAAIDHAFAAADIELVDRLVLRVSQPAYNAGRTDTVRGWFDALASMPGRERYPVAAATAAVFFALTGDAGRAERWAELAAAGARRDEPTQVGMIRFASALLCRHGALTMLQDADVAAASLAVGHPYHPAARLLAGVARDVAGQPDEADRMLADGLEVARTIGGLHSSVAIALMYRASLAIRRSAWVDAESFTREARSVVREGNLTEQVTGLAIDAVSARVAAHHGAVTQARTDIAHAQRLRPALSHALPWMAVRARLELCSALLTLGDPGGARILMGEIEDILDRRPGLDSLVKEVGELRVRLEAARGVISGATMLTIAELRLLPLLATHLTFPDVAGRLVLSTNTVKTQAKSIYRKLEVASRSEAVERARDIGLLERPTFPMVSA